MKSYINLTLIGATVRGTDLRSDASVEEFCVINDENLDGIESGVLQEYIIQQYRRRGYEVAEVLFENTYGVRLELNQLYRRRLEQEREAPPQQEIKKGGDPPPPPSPSEPQADIQGKVMYNGQLMNARRAASLEKQDILARLQAYRVAKGPGCLQEIESVSGGKVPVATLRSMLESKPHTILEWRLLRDALDKLVRMETGDGA